MWGLLYFFVAAAAVCGNRRIKTLEKISEKKCRAAFFCHTGRKRESFFFVFYYKSDANYDFFSSPPFLLACGIGKDRSHGQKGFRFSVSRAHI